MASERPNILLLLVDEQSPLELGCYGGRKVRTPAVDGLAANTWPIVVGCAFQSAGDPRIG